ncbi:hypothetical protein RM844_20565 [Streptomyces sp. DSM 44915]|uniref:Secreted protein n=1 Tax=Streptomyces chisholmiae TaxID=3075540 RepID=A0ABU2JUM1_9ACTN|nr:hypothetical protein [Streptomyces sp. DSM 44915]MDT0268683.1 hypothetical protein [Streptomyces sp. DSM 44915]
MARRRASGVLLSLLAAGAWIGLLPGEAMAAQGSLKVSGAEYLNPGAGCYPGQEAPLLVENETNTTVAVFAGSQCNGERLANLPPQSSAELTTGGSVYVAH